MERKHYIEEGSCCGYLQCANVRTLADSWSVGYSNDEYDPEFYEARHGSPEDRKGPIWRCRYHAVQRALQDAVKRGFLTAEEAEQLLREWLEENPDPEPAEEPGIDVTKELEAVGKPIPVLLPERVEVERD